MKTIQFLFDKLWSDPFNKKLSTFVLTIGTIAWIAGMAISYFR